MIKRCMKTMDWAIIGVSILAAAWIIVSQDLLQGLGLQNQKLIDVLAYVPAICVIFMAACTSSGATACEKRMFKRLLRLK